jgi:Clostripain family
MRNACANCLVRFKTPVNLAIKNHINTLLLLAVILVFAFILGGCGQEDPQNLLNFPVINHYAADGSIIPVGSDTWTILVYSISDNNLDKYLPSQIEDMMSIGSTDKVKIIVQADRLALDAECYGEEVPGIVDWSTAKRLIVQHGSVEELEDLGEVDMCSQFIFSDFVEWGLTHYPAEHYILVIDDHGSGWRGFGQDYSSINNDDLTLGEIGEALETAFSKFPLEKLDLIVFDACYMASVEVVEAVYQYSDFMVGHSGKSWSPSSYWENVLEHLNLTLHPSGFSAGKRFAKSYMDDHLFNEYDTVSMIDLSYTADLRNLISDLSHQLVGDLDEMFEPIMQAFHDADIQFSSDPKSDRQLVDIFHFIEMLNAISVDYSLLYERAVQLQSKLVLFNWASDNLPGSKGLTIYFPQFYSWPYNYDFIYGMDDWRLFLSEFIYCQLTSVEDVNIFIDTLPDVEREDDGSVTITGYFKEPSPDVNRFTSVFRFGKFGTYDDEKFILGEVYIETNNSMYKSDYLTIDFRTDSTVLNWAAKTMWLEQNGTISPVSFTLWQQGRSPVFCYLSKFYYYADGDPSSEPEIIYRDIYVDISSAEVIDDLYYRLDEWSGEFVPKSGSILAPLLKLRTNYGVEKVPAEDVFFQADQPIEIEWTDSTLPGFIEFEMSSASPGYGYLYSENY